MREADLPRNPQRGQRRRTEVPIEHPGIAATDDVERTGDWQRRDRQPTGQRLEEHEPKCLGAARQYENISRRIVPHQRLAFLTTGEVHQRVPAPHHRQQVAVADDQFRAGEIEIQKLGQVFFRYNSPDVKEYRPWQIDSGRTIRPEHPDVDAARPQDDPGESFCRELASHRFRRHHNGARRPMESAQRRVGPAGGDVKACLQIFREFGVIGGCETKVAFQAIFARGQA